MNEGVTWRPLCRGGKDARKRERVVQKISTEIHTVCSIFLAKDTAAAKLHFWHLIQPIKYISLMDLSGFSTT